MISPEQSEHHSTDIEHASKQTAHKPFPLLKPSKTKRRIRLEFKEKKTKENKRKQKRKSGEKAFFRTTKGKHTNLTNEIVVQKNIPRRLPSEGMRECTHQTLETPAPLKKTLKYENGKCKVVNGKWKMEKSNG
jgi:hypothetical protein